MWGIVRGVGGVRKSVDWSWLAKGQGLGLLCWYFKGVQEEIPSEEASNLQIGFVALRYNTIEEMKEAVTKVIDTLTQEDFNGAFQMLLGRYNKCISARGD